MDNMREKRKMEHINMAITTDTGPLTSGWEDIHLIHQALLDSNVNEVDTSVTIFNKKLSMPVIINAITGGAEGLEKINRSLAELARLHGLGMAVGSQTAGIINKKLEYTYKVVREVNPTGLIFANVSAGENPEIALSAVDMIGADALQLHLNGVQELIMPEGDKNFKDWAENIKYICRYSPVPVIVKETGNGISLEAAHKLALLGVKGIDSGGSGGTNFAAIELARHKQENLDFLTKWGITSTISLMEICSLNLDLIIFASGGIAHSSDIIKALALGADAVGIAGSFLRLLIKEGVDSLDREIKNILKELKTLMLLTGAHNIADIRNIPLVITGFTHEWCEQRGIKVSKWAQRGRSISDG